MSAPLRWISGNDTGMSSKAIWEHMMLGDVTRELRSVPHPHDPDDFGRCYRLLRIMPDWQSRIGEMAKYSSEWAALVAVWPRLALMYETISDPQGRQSESGREMYAYMSDLLTRSRVCCDCGTVGMNAWSSYHDGLKRCSSCAQKHREAA